MSIPAHLLMMNWNAENLLNLIRQGNDIATGFSLNVAQQLLEIGRVSLLPANEAVTIANARLSSLHIPLSAPMLAFSADEPAPKHIYDKGKLIGLNHALASLSFPYRVLASQPIEILTIPVMHLRSLIEHDSSIRWQLIEYIAIQNIKNKQIATNIISSDPASRLANLLLDLANRYGESGENEEIQLNIKISQDELGKRIGASRQSVNKYLHDFIENSYIRKNGHRYVLLDIQSLKDLAKSK